MSIAKGTRLDGLEGLEELWRAFLESGAVVRVGIANCLDIGGEVTEEECVLLTNVFGDFWSQLKTQ